MPPTVKDLPAVRGDTFSRTITCYDQDGAILNLTGCTLWFTVKLSTDTATDDDDAITKCYWVSGGASSGISVASPSTGVAKIDAPATDMAALDPNLDTYRYDIQVEDANEHIYTLALGALTVTGDETRRVVTP